ncbi:hypothetical protein LX64_02252 [Chitinophaga skermanii]|uniref:Uncharacterized protein n=1 Tax=Chitinophaga skermanii TaxID=331697 RepID=A0A327QM44_9BACT|nr:hypothetical protein [Chitinophaga skermanii]RAJ05098.1 hypothetical protein LX64_02252 [Chitinophaga skermanii]
MKHLSETWFADGYIDFELKKYTLLAYLQEINRQFNQSKLYPPLGDIIFHYNNLVAFKENKHLLEQHFPKQLTGFNLEQLQLIYEQIAADDELMEELAAIIEYGLNEMKQTITDGTKIYEFVEGKLEVAPVGIVPLQMNEGYLLLRDSGQKQTLVYQYRITIFERHDEKYRGIHTDFMDAYKLSVGNTYESIKSELIKKHRDALPNPAVYKIETDLALPITETLLPIAKRSLVKYITQHAA